MKDDRWKNRLMLFGSLAHFRLSIFSSLRLSVLMLVMSGSAHGQWILEPGKGWAQIGIFHQDTRERYGLDGTVGPYFGDGHAITSSLYLTAAYGLVTGLDAWVQVPFHRLEYNDVGGDRFQSGLGDPRLYLRAGPSIFGIPNIPVAIRLGVKLPVADFPIDAEIIPLGEGQLDTEFILESGWSFYPVSAYVAGWVGYRQRYFSERTDKKPGNEVFMYLAAGGSWNGFTAKVGTEALSGGAPIIQRLRIESAKRRLAQGFVTLGRDVGPAVIELGARLPFSGQNYSAGVVWTAGLFVDW